MDSAVHVARQAGEEAREPGLRRAAPSLPSPPPHAVLDPGSAVLQRLAMFEQFRIGVLIELLELLQGEFGRLAGVFEIGCVGGG